jgi:hypothetical protein
MASIERQYRQRITYLLLLILSMTSKSLANSGIILYRLSTTIRETHQLRLRSVLSRLDVSSSSCGHFNFFCQYLRADTPVLYPSHLHLKHKTCENSARCRIWTEAWPHGGDVVFSPAALAFFARLGSFSMSWLRDAPLTTISHRKHETCM